MIIDAIRALPGAAELRRLNLQEGSTIADVRLATGWQEPFTAVFGERVQESHTLSAGDRVEFLRALIADPKDSRRKRAERNPLPRTRRTAKSLRA